MRKYYLFFRTTYFLFISCALGIGAPLFISVAMAAQGAPTVKPSNQPTPEKNQNSVMLERTGPIEQVAELRSYNPSGDRALGITMQAQRIPVEEQDLPPPSSEVAFYVNIAGSFSRSDWSITVEYESEPLKRTPDGKFSRRFRLSGPVSKLNLIAISPKGEVQKVSFQVVYPDYIRRTQQLQALRSRRPFSFSVGMGVSSLNYVAGSTTFKEYGLTPKASFTLRNPKWEKWRFTGNTFFTAFAFGASTYYPDPKGHPTLVQPVSVRYFGANVRAGYKTNVLKSPWSLELQFGWYYSTMLVSPQYFGYTNANGPQVFPVFERELSKKDLIGAYFKFSPVSSGIAVLSPTTNYEIASGAYYLLPPTKKPYRFSLSADFAYLSLQPVAGAVRSNVTSVTLGGGISF